MSTPYEVTYRRDYNKLTEKYSVEVTLRIETDKDGEIPESLLSSKELMGEVLAADWGHTDGYDQVRCATLSHVDRDDLEAMVTALDADIRSQMNPTV